MGNYNPDLPYVLGMQWAPLVTDQVLLDTGTEIGYTFRTVTDWHALGTNPDRVRVLAAAPPGQPVRKELIVNLYHADEITATGAIRKLVVPCTSGASLAGAALGGGAASHQQAVSNPSDTRFVTLTGPNAAARFWFATTTATTRAALQGRRILDVTVLYAVSGPVDVVAGALTLGVERPSANLNWLMDDTLTGPASQSAAVQVLRARLGELNPWWSPTLTPAATAMRVPWIAQSAPLAPTPVTGLDALAAAGGTNINLRIGTAAGVPAGTVFQIHYAALEITYGEESRVGAGGLDITAGATMADGGYFYDVPIWQTFNVGYPVSTGPGGRFAVTVGQAYSGALSVASPVPVLLPRLGTIGAFPDHAGVLVRKTIRDGSVPVTERAELMPALVLVAPTGAVEAGAHAYTSQAIGSCYQRFSRGASSQVLVDAVAGTFHWATFYARHLPGTLDPLLVEQIDAGNGDTLLGPSGQVTVKQFDTLPEVANGWKKVTVALDPPLVTTGAGGLLRFGFESYAADGSPWQVLGADSNPAAQTASPANLASSAGETGHAWLDNVPDLSADYTLSLVRAMDPVTGFTVTPAVQNLAVVDPHACRPGRAVATGIRYHRLSWDAVNTEMVRGWAYFQVDRQDDTMPAGQWETIAQVPEPTVTSVDDYEARVGVATRYRIRTVHRTGIGGPFSDPVEERIAAPGVTGVHVDAGVLILTSNQHPQTNLAYVMSWDRTAPEDFTFGEAGMVDLQAVYGRDFKIALRPTERGGVEFTRTVLINAVSIPPATLDAGFRQLRDLAWDQLPYVCVRDELNNRWLATVLVPSGSVQRRQQGHLMLAQLTVVEVSDTPAPLTGGPAPCEGLRPDGAQSVDVQCDTTINLMSTVVGSDSFTRQVTGGWGNTEQPGGPWQLQGPPETVSVAGGVASIVVAQTRNTNPTFETGTAGWTPYGATATRSTAQAHQGAASMLVTPSGTAETAHAESEPVSGALAGTNWRATAWVRCAVARPVLLSINWYDGNGVYLTTSAAPAVAVAANTWTRLQFTAAAAAGSARASMNVGVNNTPPVTHLLFVDEAAIGPAPQPVQLLTTTTAAGADVDVRARLRLDQIPVGAPILVALIARDAAGSHYRAVCSFHPDRTIGVSLERVDAGTSTVIADEQTQQDPDLNPLTFTVGQWISFAFQARGQMLLASAYADATVPYWTVNAIDTAYPGPGRTGVRAVAGAGNQNLTARVDVDDVTARDPIGDLDVRMLLRPNSEDDWVIGVEHDAGLNRPDGFLTLAYAALQADTFGLCFDADGFDSCADPADLRLTPRQRRWLRVTYEQNIGGGLARTTYWTSVDGQTWSPAGVRTGPPYPIPIDGGLFLTYVTGPVTLSRLEWRDGINGPLLASPDFSAQPPGTTTFSDPQGNVWEVGGRGICAPA